MTRRQCIPARLHQYVNHDLRLIFKARLVFKARPLLPQLRQTLGLYSRPGLYLRPGFYSRKYGIWCLPQGRINWEDCGTDLAQKWGEDGGGSWLVRMEWRPAGLLVSAFVIFPCTIISIKSIRFLQAPAELPVWTQCRRKNSPSFPGLSRAIIILFQLKFC